MKRKDFEIEFEIRVELYAQILNSMISLKHAMVRFFVMKSLPWNVSAEIIVDDNSHWSMPTFLMG